MKKFLLYGAASIGGIVKDTLESCGYDVVGYIDKRAHEMKQYNGLPVWSLHNVPEIGYESKTVIYIAVKNVFEHEKIAKQLFKAGFQQLIYKPYHVLLGNASNNENLLAQLYDDLFEGRLQGVEFEIPNNNDEGELCDYALISRENGQVTAYIPVEYIVTNDYQDEDMHRWGNVPIPCFFTHINFFRSLDGDQECSVIPYLKEYCEFTAKIDGKIQITDAWRDNVIANRTHIFEQMSESLCLDPLFFTRNVATAVWNWERKYFNLTSGKHRCTFLAAKGNKYIPLKMSETDYEEFKNISQANVIKKNIDLYDGTVLIPNPCFYRGIHNRDFGEHSFLLWFSRYFGEKLFYAKGKVDFTGFRVVDRSDDEGHFSRYLYRCGAQVWRWRLPDELEILLNGLFRAELDYVSQMVRKADVLIVDERTALELKRNDFYEAEYIILKSVTQDVQEQICARAALRIEKIIDSMWKGTVLYRSYLMVKNDSKDSLKCISEGVKNESVSDG